MCYDASDQVFVPGDAENGGVVLDAAKRSNTMNEALQNFNISMLSAVHSLLENSQLYTFNEKELRYWADVTRCRLKNESFLFIFREVFLRVMEALGVSHGRRQNTQKAKVDE